MKAALITGSFWELYIFIKQLNKKWNFLYVKDQENKRELHKDASVSKHFQNAGTGAPTRFLYFSWERMLANGIYPRKRLTSSPLHIIANWQQIPVLGKLSWKAKCHRCTNWHCFAPGMGRTYIPGVLYILLHLVLTIILNCSFYYPLLYSWGHRKYKNGTRTHSWDLVLGLIIKSIFLPPIQRFSLILSKTQCVSIGVWYMPEITYY